MDKPGKKGPKGEKPAKLSPEEKKAAKGEKKEKKPKGKALAELCKAFEAEEDCPTDKCSWRLPTKKECKPTKRGGKGPKASEDDDAEAEEGAEEEADVCSFKICGP